MQGTQRYVIFAFLVGAVLVWTTLAQLLGGIAFLADIPDPPILGERFTVTTAIGLGVAAVAFVVALAMRRPREFSSEVVTELRQVTWPDRKEIQRSTVVVIVTTLVVSMLLGVFDFLWAQLTSLIYA
ncbi:MAG TPA: preprotein translocase subunit SecE [Myxococcales bacterium LLY-WYZ-16_1]|nr:preprotein translocase subunit SecE [Myxococcales bacterium LLY-WYZ-16_1]